MSETKYPNTGPGCAPGRYRTGEVPQVGDRISAHGVNLDGSADSIRDYTNTTLVVRRVDREYIGCECGPQAWYAARFDLISRAPATAEPVAEELDALRDALWVCMEHNRLHHGPNHNTVIQAEEALQGWTPPPPKPVLTITDERHERGWVYAWTKVEGQFPQVKGMSVTSHAEDVGEMIRAGRHVYVHENGPLVVCEADWPRVLELVAMVNKATPCTPAAG